MLVLISEPGTRFHHRHKCGICSCSLRLHSQCLLCRWAGAEPPSSLRSSKIKTNFLRAAAIRRSFFNTLWGLTCPASPAGVSHFPLHQLVKKSTSSFNTAIYKHMLLKCPVFIGRHALRGGFRPSILLSFGARVLEPPFPLQTGKKALSKAYFS